MAVQVNGVQLEPHWFGVPPPPHVWPLGHAPQSTVPLQPSLWLPQVALAAAHAAEVLAGWHVGAPHSYGTPPPAQVAPPEQVPQSMKPPQPSSTVPHAAFTALQVAGTQVEAPHTLGVWLAPQIWPCGQPPQLYVSLQPLLTTPHLPAHAVA